MNNCLAPIAPNIFALILCAMNTIHFARTYSEAPKYQENTMKGIVFSEFIEMVEDKFSPEIADQIIQSASGRLKTGGSYTSVGVYDHIELVELVKELSAVSNIPVDDLVTTFGVHLAGRFSVLYPTFFEGVTSTLDFLESVDNHIHIEVKKLYPGAELPEFKTERNGSQLIMEYSSTRPFSSLAKGLIEGSGLYYGETLEVEAEDLSKGLGNHMRFTITRV